MNEIKKIEKSCEVDLIDDGFVRFIKNFITPKEATELMEELLETCKWVQGTFMISNRPVKTPRLQAWMADEDISPSLFQKSDPLPWSDKMIKVKKSIEAIWDGKIKFNYVLINYYRDGKDSIAYHCDDEAFPEGKNYIGSVSLGQTRRFLMRHKKYNEVKTCKYEFPLSHGSLITMEKETQKHWKHCVPKQRRIKEGRINLTFRIA